MDAYLIAGIKGFLIGGSLIIAIGSQNAYVLRQGLRREAVLIVIAICAISDVLLIIAGSFGFGFLVAQNPVIVSIASLVGAVFLFAYGGLACKRALFHKGSLNSTNDKAEKTPVASIIIMTTILTWANPHVYLDTVILLGSIAAQYETSVRIAFAFGASVASIVWFTLLGVGARALAPLFANARTWQILDLAIAVIMWLIAISLVQQTNWQHLIAYAG